MISVRQGRALRLLATATAAMLVVVGATSCSSRTTSSSPAATGRLRVVAAENFWGSIAAQLGGTKVAVTSIITSPDTDPHDYEPTPADGRVMAGARYAIVNGIGYDPWAAKLISANPVKSRRVLTVGDLVGIKEGGNPHRWYSPPDVNAVINRIVADYKALSPGDASYFDSQKAAFLANGLSRYRGLIADIKAKYAGTPVGASESIFAPLADALGLKLLTPSSFLTAISEGSDPTAQDKATCDAQITSHQIKVYIFNSQNSTPDVQAQINAAKAAGIPVASVTETLTPAGASFQDWQAAQLADLETALAHATGK